MNRPLGFMTGYAFQAEITGGMFPEKGYNYIL
jgi:hypothetical protein